MTAHKAELAQLISDEVGKPLWEANAEVGAVTPQGPNPDLDPAAWEAWHRHQHEDDGSSVTKR